MQEIKDLKNTQKKGIWVWERLLPSAKYQITENEGNTKIVKFNLYGEKFAAKLESENPTGSQKDRSIAFQISKELENPKNKAFTVSSSGNLASSISFYLKELEDFKFIALLPKNTSNQKILEILRNENSFVIISENPKKESLSIEKLGIAKSLRQSTSENSFQGYQTIAYEIFESGENFDSIFVPVSSGVTLIGIYKGFEVLRKHFPSIKMPRFFAIQTTEVFSVAKSFGDFKKEKNHPAKAICDHICYKKLDILEILEKTGGGSIAVDKKETLRCHKILKENGFDVSEESAILLSASKKLLKDGEISKPLLIFTGKDKSSSTNESMKKLLDYTDFCKRIFYSNSLNETVDFLKSANFNFKFKDKLLK